ncbi:MAG: glycosyltransferase [Acetobacter sp.]|nr:glycosyltransferase [Bacteroides sp.]MCM1341564.1 glycosyltransferase [Acetobacter sp.]MCM1433641.1 glycosyltransferase [Clostridiales bacterium]
MECLISIIVPIYNVEKYINKCVDSILSQTYKNIELILVDDGSPDNCPQICDRYAELDKRVKVVHKENGGLMSARQAGLKKANGDYIGFVDGDDWIEPDMYECFHNVIEKYNPDMALCEFIYAYPDKDIFSDQKLSAEYFTKDKMIKEIYPTMLFKAPYYHFGINPCCWSKVYKKELLENCLYKVTPKIKIGEDAAFTYPCLIDAESLAYVDKALYHYRNNPDSMTNSYDVNLENTILIPIEILNDAFNKSGYNFSKSLSYYLLYMINLVVRNEANPDNKKSAKEKKLTLKKFVLNNNVKCAVENINYSILPVHTRVFAKFLSAGSVTLVYLYSVLLKYFL